MAVVVYEEAVSAWNESRSFPGANFGGPSTATRVGVGTRETRCEVRRLADRREAGVDEDGEWEAVLQTRHEHCCCHSLPNYLEGVAGVKPCPPVVIIICAGPQGCEAGWLAAGRATPVSTRPARSDQGCGWWHGVLLRAVICHMRAHVEDCPYLSCPDHHKF